MELRGRDRGWRVRLRVELQHAERWQLVPPEIGSDGKRHRGLSYGDAVRLAQYWADRGRRVRLVDPDGGESTTEVPKVNVDVKAWGLTMP